MTFEEWLNTEEGKKANEPNIIIFGYSKYLQNRLYWAYEAGVKSGEIDRRLQLTIDWYEDKLSELKSRNRKLVRELNELKSATGETGEQTPTVVQTPIT